MTLTEDDLTPPTEAIDGTLDGDPDRSIVSNLTAENLTVENEDAGSIARVRSGVGSLFATSWGILLGQPPGPPVEEDMSDEDTINGSKKFLFESSNKIIDEEPEPPKIDFLQDSPSDMTFGRRIAIALSHKKWYNPRVEQQAADKDGYSGPKREARPPKVTKEERPSLAKAWAYFDHFALPRFMLDEEGKFDRNDLKRAEPGECEHPTKLYHGLCTPLNQMGDFGLGIGLYFSTLRALTILTFLAGLLNIPNLIYYSSDEYSDGQHEVANLIKGSAICTRELWVPCDGCLAEDFEGHRWASKSFVNGTGQAVELVFALRNACVGATFQQGMINYGTLLLVLVGILVLNMYQKKCEIAFDEDEQTAQDYSIRIQNPPSDAVDPKEWRNYFKDVFDAHATVVTVALDNDPLIRALRERRECIRKIELNLPPATSLDVLVLAKNAAEVEAARGIFGKILAMVAPGIPELFGRIAALEGKIKGWAQLDYPCSNVFVTFETEEEQRRVLSALSLGTYHVNRQNKSKIDEKYLFRGQLILKLKEPDEPNTIRWADLNVKFLDKVKPLATTTFFSLIAIFLIALVINVVHNQAPLYSAIVIAIFNSAFPIIAKLLTELERHSSEGLKQTSLYFKIAVFRWVNTAVIITVITPFTATLSNDGGLIPTIFAIFFAEITTTNAIQLLDPMGHIQRHFLAPRAVTQDAMNLAMQGQEVQLAERYTNMTKILFLTLWYCSIYPGALFMCSFALAVNYFTDGFSLMRTWKKIPQLGTRISRFSRRYFFSTAIVAMSVVSAYYWTGFTYDNLCENDTPVSGNYLGTHSITLKDGTIHNETLVFDDSSTSYRFCFQDYLRYGNITFPALSRWQPEGGEWMSAEQETIVDIHGWTSLAVFGIIIFAFINLIVKGCQSMFSTSGHKHVGDDQGIHFSDVRGISAFIPQVDSKVYSYPLLACDVTGLDDELFDWTDPDRPHSYYDLTEDADELIGDISVREKLVFSIVSHAPPPKK